MPRPVNPDLIVNWKIGMPATLAGRIEHVLLDPIHSIPIYGARGKLIAALLERWLAQEEGVSEDLLPHVPTLLELRQEAARA